MSIKVLVIPNTDAPLEVREIERGLDSYQSIVDGNIEAVSLPTIEGSIYLNEEGKIQRRRGNPRATNLWWSLNIPMIGNDILVGDCFATGPVDDEGNDTDVPEVYQRIIEGTEKFRVDILAFGETRWSTNALDFDSAEKAITYGVRLRARWSMVDRMRVIPQSVPRSQMYQPGSENIQ